MDVKKYKEILENSKPKEEEGNVAVVIFKENHIIVQVYLKQTLQRECVMKKKDFTYEVGLVVLSNVSRVFSIGDKTIEDAEKINLIAEIQNIDITEENTISTNIEFTEDGSTKKKYIN